MEKTHWKKLTNPNYIGAYALQPGQEPVVTIKTVAREMVTGPDGKKEECVVAHFEERGVKPMILNATNMKTITKLYKTPYIEEWSGKRIQIYADKVKAFGEIVEALRIRPTVPKSNEPKKAGPIHCEECGSEIKGFGKMDAGKMAVYTADKYGKQLCADCAKSEAVKADPLGGGNDESDNE